MNARREALWRRRTELVHESMVLRERLAVHGQALTPALLWGDRVRDGVRWLRERPWVPVVAVALLAARRPRKVWRWGTRAWGVWRTVSLWTRRWRDLSGAN